MNGYRNVAASVRERKERHPELYCADPRCLWRTVNQAGVSPCPKHAVALKECEISLRHWAELAAKANDPSVVRVNGQHYIVCPDETNPKAWKGHGGTEFRIRYFDGRVVVTHNLWNQGKIPQKYRQCMPDNAEFLAAWWLRSSTQPSALEVSQ